MSLYLLSQKKHSFGGAFFIVLVTDLDKEKRLRESRSLFLELWGIGVTTSIGMDLSIILNTTSS